MDLEEKTKNNINSIIMNDDTMHNMQTQVNIEVNMLNDPEYDNFLFTEYGIES